MYQALVNYVETNPNGFIHLDEVDFITMSKILVGSQNPVKLEATHEAFACYFSPVEVIGLSVESGVPAQPLNDDTLAGAKNRTLALWQINSAQDLGADFFVGIEGGIVQRFSRWFAFGGMCIADHSGRLAFGMSPHFELPEAITHQLLAGAELGHVIDALTGDHNSKQKGGAIGYLTHGLMDRQTLYVQGLIMALIPLVNEGLYAG
jgi:inosine/xanthosine triphosphatase